MKFFVKAKLSDNISETPEGFLLCKNVPLTHTGVLTYAKGEHPFPEVDTLEITRSKDELFSDETISSFIGKSLTIEHPKDFVKPENWQDLTHGHILNVRPSPEQIEVNGKLEDALLGDLLITTKESIGLVKDGIREVSLGYDALWTMIDESKAVHTKIRGNHIALVSAGRAGKDFSIKDTGVNIMKKQVEKFKKFFGKTLDEAIAEKEKEAAKDVDKVADIEAKIAALKEELEAAKKAKDEMTEKKDETKDSDVETRLAKIEEMLMKLVGMEEKEASDEEVEIVEDEECEDEETMDMDKTKDMDKKDKASDSIDADTKADAEILAPGIALTKDVKIKALEVAYKTKDGKKIIDILTKGAKLSEVKDHSVIFTAAAEMLKEKRTKDFSTQSSRTSAIDAFPSLKNGSVTAEDINKRNAELYKLN